MPVVLQTGKGMQIPKTKKCLVNKKYSTTNHANFAQSKCRWVAKAISRRVIIRNSKNTNICRKSQQELIVCYAKLKHYHFRHFKLAVASTQYKQSNIIFSRVNIVYSLPSSFHGPRWHQLLTFSFPQHASLPPYL